MGFPWEKSHELNHEHLVIFPLKFSQDFNGFWFHSATSNKGLENITDYRQNTPKITD